MLVKLRHMTEMSTGENGGSTTTVLAFKAAPSGWNPVAPVWIKFSMKFSRFALLSFPPPAADPDVLLPQNRGN